MKKYKVVYELVVETPHGYAGDFNGEGVKELDDYLNNAITPSCDVIALRRTTVEEKV